MFLDCFVASIAITVVGQGAPGSNGALIWFSMQGFTAVETITFGVDLLGQSFTRFAFDTISVI